jgi:hypothetical protein
LKSRVAVSGFGVDTVEEKYVKVDIEVQCTTESLDQRHRAGLRGLSGETRLLDQVRRYCPVYNTQHPIHQLRTAGKQEAQLKRKAQHPLTYRLFRQELIDQLFMVALGALYTQESMFQPTTLEIF